MSEQADVQVVGERIERLLDEIGATATPVVAELAEELVRQLMALYGAGLERLLELVRGAPDASPMLRALADDELVASLLVLHDLHPVNLRMRVEEALDGVRPYLGSHGGDVEVLDVTDGVVRLRLGGSCDGCPSSQQTLTYAVSGAIRQAAPEISEIAVEEGASAQQPSHPPRSRNGLIPPDALSLRRRESDEEGWAVLDMLGSVASGSLADVAVGGVELVVCRAEEQLYAYRAACPGCGDSLRRGALRGTALTCQDCGRRYDVHLAGRGLDDDGLHLQPVPLLEDDEGVRVALGATAT